MIGRIAGALTAVIWYCDSRGCQLILFLGAFSLSKGKSKHLHKLLGARLTISYLTTSCPGRHLLAKLCIEYFKLNFDAFNHHIKTCGWKSRHHISNINMYKFIKIRHDIIKQCHEHYKVMKIFNYKLEIEIFRNSTLKKLGALRGSF